jgi:hypothetical protein
MYYVIQRIAGFAITLYYHPAGLIITVVVHYHFQPLIQQLFIRVSNLSLL